MTEAEEELASIEMAKRTCRSGETTVRTSLKNFSPIVDQIAAKPLLVYRTPKCIFARLHYGDDR